MSIKCNTWHWTNIKQDNFQANSESVQCFRRDINVCPCALSALILLPVVNLPLEIDSVISVSYNYDVESSAVRRLFLRFFHCACTVSIILQISV